MNSRVLLGIAVRGFVLLPIKHKTNFKLNTMSESTKQTSNEAENGNKSKPLLCAGTKLISMTDFVLERDKSEEVCREDFIKCRNYANFLSKTFTLGMFVPTDLQGNVLEEPESLKGFYETDLIGMNAERILRESYLKAKERVIFEGFKLVDYGKTDISKTISYENVLHTFWFSSITQVWTRSVGHKTIEDLTKYGLCVKLDACT